MPAFPQEGGRPLWRFSRNLRRMVQRGGAADEPNQAGAYPHGVGAADEAAAAPGAAGAPRRKVLGALKSRLRMGGRDRDGAAAADSLPSASSFDYEAGMGFPTRVSARRVMAAPADSFCR